MLLLSLSEYMHRRFSAPAHSYQGTGLPLLHRGEKCCDGSRNNYIKVCVCVWVNVFTVCFGNVSLSILGCCVLLNRISPMDNQEEYPADLSPSLVSTFISFLLFSSCYFYLSWILAKVSDNELSVCAVIPVRQAADWSLHSAYHFWVKNSIIYSYTLMEENKYLKQFFLLSGFKHNDSDCK